MNNTSATVQSHLIETKSSYISRTWILASAEHREPRFLSVFADE